MGRVLLISFVFISLASCSGDTETSMPQGQEQEIIISAANLILEIDEHPNEGDIIGKIDGSVNQGSLTYTLKSTDPEGALGINSANGEISVADESLYEYDDYPKITALAQLSSGGKTKEVTVTINLIEVEEISIVIDDFEVSIDENPEMDALLGQVNVTANTTEISFSLGNVVPEGAIAIDTNTGEIKVLDPMLFNFEERSSITASVIVNGNGTMVNANVLININDISDVALSSFSKIEPSGSIFSGRTKMKAIAYNGKLFVIGGWDGGQNTEVWVTENGMDWQLLGNFGDAGSAGLEVQAVVFNNKLWVITSGSGSSYPSEIWSSVDGLTWVEEIPTGDFFGLTGVNILVFEGKLWAIGGTPEEDSGVWSSSDGINWTKETSNGADFTGLTLSQAVVFNDQIFVLGGYRSGIGSSNEVWSSSDGVNWTQVTLTGPGFNAEVGHQALVFDNKLWVIGGIGVEYLNEVWSSSDGAIWQQEVFNGEVFPPRAYHALAAFKSGIWVIGGRFENDPRLNDVWRLN